MAETSLLFNLLARDGITHVVKGVSGAFGKMALGLGGAALFVGAKAITMGADFQQGMTRIVTGAGEAQKNMGLVSNGVLNLAGKVGESTGDLSKGLYLIESAGFHASDALKVLEISAEGAKVGNADMATVADAVTTALNAYHMGAQGAAAATNALIAAEGQGKTNLEALASSLSTVAPIAAAAHVGLNEVLGAMATMTSQGTDAASAATYLKQTIGQLSNPSGKAAREMKDLGLTSVQVGQSLGHRGLAATLNLITDAVTKHMGPAGTVLIQHLKDAAKNTTAFQKVLADIPPAQQTYVGALATMVGGTKSMQAALELTGGNMKTFVANTNVINEKVKSGGKNIEGWALVQKNFNQHLAQANGTVEALGIRLGTLLLPYVTKLVDAFSASIPWMSKHQGLMKTIGIAALIVVSAFVLYKATVMAIAAPMKIWIALQELLTAVMDLSPVGLIVLAVAALAVGIYYLWTHSAAFRKFFIAAWHDIWGVLKAIGAWFAGPFAGAFVYQWRVIWGFFKTIGAWFGGPFAHFFVSGWQHVWGFLKAIGSWFAGPFAGFFVGLWHVVYGAFMAVQNVITAVITRIISVAMRFIGIVSRIVVSFVNLFKWLIVQAIRPFWTIFMAGLHAWEAGILVFYHAVVLPIFHAIGAAITWLAGIFTWLVVWVRTRVVLPLAAAILWVGNRVIAIWDWLASKTLAFGHFIWGIIVWVGGFINHWYHVWLAGFHIVLGLVEGFVAKLEGPWHRVLAGIKGLADGAIALFKGLGSNAARGFHIIVDAVKGDINIVIGLINSAIGFVNRDFIDKANKIPGVNFPHIGNIPQLAAGGVVPATPGGRLVLVGEGGRDEEIRPLGSRGSAQTMRLVIDVRGGDGELKKLLRKWVRVDGGGDVQTAFGS
jgi:TP901 family phage tail tape measure protein